MLNKILYVFSKEYKKEIEYFEFLEKNKKYIKLKNNIEENIDDKIQRLIDIDYKSNFHISIGDFDL